MSNSEDVTLEDSDVEMFKLFGVDFDYYRCLELGPVGLFSI
jgi:hypothetical protein